MGVVVKSLPGVSKDAVGVRLEGQGRTLHYRPSQLLLLPPPPIAGVSLACLRSFREVQTSLNPNPNPSPNPNPDPYPNPNPNRHRSPSPSPSPSPLPLP